VARRETPRFHGFLIVDKPAGWTSHDVVAKIRRLTRQRAVGHAGTLDPAATGVLPIALGDATRVLNATDDASKTYLAEITFGTETDTFDADGRLTTQRDASQLSLDVIEALLPGFLGVIRQQAPRYSAIQRGGRRLYDLARQGIAFDAPWREVVIHDLLVVDFTPPILALCVDCGSGTYIRSVAHDLGVAAGMGAHLSNLIRLRSGPFTLDHAWTISALERIPLAEQWPSIALHPDSAISQTAAIILNPSQQSRWSTGKTILLSRATEGQTVRAYTVAGDWIGYGVTVLTEDGPTVQPRRVITKAMQPSS
jgi:tRNA pseudouridine55 synthase